MKFGLYAPNFGNTFGDPNVTIELIEEAEKAGWDGFFLWDHILYPGELYPGESTEPIDPFITLAGAAVKTEKILIGTTVTAIPRRRPWKLAKECVTIDHLSNGRFVLGMGLGGQVEMGMMNEETDPVVAARMVNEQIEILNGLWSGEDFSYDGEFYKIDKTEFLPKPVQQPRIKLWGAGSWPKKGPFRRAAKLDGSIPLHASSGKPLSLEEMEQLIGFVKDQEKIDDSYDFVRISWDDVHLDLNKLSQFRDAGVNWYLVTVSAWTGDTEAIREVIKQGPPKL